MVYIRLRNFITQSAFALCTLALSGCGGGNNGFNGDLGADINAAANAAAAADGRAQLPGSGPNTSEPPVDEKITDADAARFLTQSTFGPTLASIEEVKQLGYAGWIDKQFALPRASTFVAEVEPLTKNGDSNTNMIYPTFYKEAVTAEDQLRARFGFALSEIFVISILPPAVNKNIQWFANYQDILHEEAFGNFRSLIERVTLHPTMGFYLTFSSSSKESATNVPDENYARELMQLFTIGTKELNLDGTPKLNANREVIETYDTDDVKGLAKIFTGIRPGGVPGIKYPPMGRSAGSYSTSEKRFLGAVIPASSSATAESMNQELKTALDVIFNHPNVGPFIGKQLIQRFVTSNPSPAYVARVAQAFNGAAGGKRGDMKATIRAVLLDPEARRRPAESDDVYGKVREPVLRLTNWLRLANTTSPDKTWEMRATGALGQTPYTSPSVFNFFRPGYSPSGTEISKRGLVAPELQITTENSVVFYSEYMLAVIANGAPKQWHVATNFSELHKVADSPQALADRLDLLLMYGSLTKEDKDRLIRSIESIPLDPARPVGVRINRVRMATILLMASPEYIVQR